ncbi:arylsulfatase [Rubinisphaera margarita]|uniref:arylsulfatase n=1 Tax=Rubinisphaera margarita TaxID=2909586 RepID=UPI001EE90ADD|nr:arylsulfatase [Rubinisphaera margarita]MCG6155892.1 arylsulfatase [Rubinisphaera margarita]
MPHCVHAVLALFVLTAICPAEERRPNIIYVMIDDAGYGDFGAMGSEHVQTPTFDRMCREGMRFTDHYSGSAVCAPTRCVLMTGLHTGHCRRRNNRASAALDQTDLNGLVFLKDEDLTVAEVLQEAGYVTGGIGKWGLGNPGFPGSPDKQGFDHFLGYLDQVHAHDHYTDWLWNDGERMPTGERYSHYIFEEDTLRFIRENRDQPFFLYLPYCLPHGAYTIPDDDPALDPYRDKPWKETVRNYAAMITRADMTVGRILDLLDELQLDDDTIVFFTSDNGPNTPFLKDLNSNGPFQGIKRTLDEGGIRAAMAVRWPGHTPAGVTSDFVWDMRDVFPTLCDLADAPQPAHLDGISVLPTLLGKEQKPREHLYWEFSRESQQAVRMGHWKGLRKGTEMPIALYDLQTDPGETNDVSAGHPDVVRRMAEIMAESHVPSPFWPLAEDGTSRKGSRKKTTP